MVKNRKMIMIGFAVVNLITGLSFCGGSIITLLRGVDVPIGFFALIIGAVIWIIGTASLFVKKDVENKENVKIIRRANSICFGISVAFWLFVLLAITGFF